MVIRLDTLVSFVVWSAQNELVPINLQLCKLHDCNVLERLENWGNPLQMACRPIHRTGRKAGVMLRAIRLRQAEQSISDCSRDLSAVVALYETTALVKGQLSLLDSGAPPCEGEMSANKPRRFVGVGAARSALVPSALRSSATQDEPLAPQFSSEATHL